MHWHHLRLGREQVRKLTLGASELDPYHLALLTTMVDPEDSDYKQRVLTTTKGGLVSRTRKYQKMESSGDGERRHATEGTSKAQLRKADKKQERLKRIADSTENPEAVMEIQTVTKELVKCLKNKDFHSAVQVFRNHRDAFRYKHNIMTLLNVCYKHEHLETAKEIVDLLRKNHGSVGSKRTWR